MEKNRPLVHGIEMQGLRRLALASPNKDAVVLIFDCCFAGLAAEEGTRGPAEATNTVERCFSDLSDVEQKETAKGVFVFSSSAKDETSRELRSCAHKLGKGEPHPHGAFTFHLIEGLMGLAAAREGGEISVAMLRNHVEGAKGIHSFEVYQTRAAKPQGIILARVTDLGLLEATVKKITEKLGSGDLRDLILAADDLSRVLKDRPNYEPAKELRPKVESGLEACKQECRNWLTGHRVELLQQLSRQEFDELDDLVFELSFARIEAEQEKSRDTLSWLTCLLRAAQEQWSVSKLVPRLQGRESAARTSPSKLKAPEIRRR
jgi:hypothetical protein